MASRPTVLITGCSPGGIGHALAREFHAKGFRVFATARSKDKVTDLAAQGIETLELEVTSDASILALKEEISTLTGGAIDFLVNNAGRNQTVPALDADIDEARLTFETNVFGVMRLTQVFAPLLIAAAADAAKAPANGAAASYAPTIVNIGSLAALMPYVFGSTYNASKAALHAYSDTLRLELAPLGVRVVTAVTGGVRSNIARTKRVLPKGSFYAPLEETYRERLVHSQANGVPAEEYARQVVRDVLRAAVKRGGWLEEWAGVWGWTTEIWAGGRVGVVWFATKFLPKRVMDWAFMRMFHLWELQRSGLARVKSD